MDGVCFRPHSQAIRSYSLHAAVAGHAAGEEDDVVVVVVVVLYLLARRCCEYLFSLCWQVFRQLAMEPLGLRLGNTSSDIRHPIDSSSERALSSYQQAQIGRVGG